MQKSKMIRSRLARLKAQNNPLGEPDIISIDHIRINTSLFTRKKTSQQHIEYYISGIVFPTTAHFSSFISSRHNNDSKSTIKAILLMFDIFQRRDIRVEINIPGSMDIKIYSLNNDSVSSASIKDYENAHYSSFLRSLFPMNYWNIVLCSRTQKFQILKITFKNFTKFSLQNSLQVQTMIQDKISSQTINSIELIIQYCLKYKLINLLNHLQKELKNINLNRSFELELQTKLVQEKYAQVIFITAEKLYKNPNSLSKLKHYQIRALFNLKKYKEIKQISQSLIHQGCLELSIWKIIAKAYYQLHDYNGFLKIISTFLTLVGDEDSYDLQNLFQIVQIKETIDFSDVAAFKTGRISQVTWLCFKFDNKFLNQLKNFQYFKSVLKNSDKKQTILNLIERVDISLATKLPFYEEMVVFAKQKSWQQIIKCRGQCFWLEKDFKRYENIVKIKTSIHQSSYMKGGSSLSEISFEESEEQDKKERKNIDLQVSESINGDFSQNQDDLSLDEIQPCSRRLYKTKNQLSQSIPQRKILCNLALQAHFLQLNKDLKLQIDLQKWSNKIQNENPHGYSKQKRQLIACTLLKKAFLHKKLLRYNKCEETLKKARNFIQNVPLNLIACELFINLYVQNRNIKGVQFYMGEMMKGLKAMNIEQFDVVPEWAKPIIIFVLETEGKNIINYQNGYFKSLIMLWLQTKYSEEELKNYIEKFDSLKI